MKLLRAALLACAAAACVSAHSHVFLEHADPKVGSVVQAAPGELSIWFSEPVEPVFSTVEVTDAAGRRVDAGRPQVDPDNRQRLRVPLGKLGAGTYTAAWRAVSVDTHVSKGRFTFHVAR